MVPFQYPNESSTYVTKRVGLSVRYLRLPQWSSKWLIFWIRFKSWSLKGLKKLSECGSYYSFVACKFKVGNLEERSVKLRMSQEKRIKSDVRPPRPASCCPASIPRLLVLARIISYAVGVLVSVYEDCFTVTYFSVVSDLTKLWLWIDLPWFVGSSMNNDHIF